jgi:transglutaminase/protease-like cytokinesis protein 3
MTKRLILLVALFGGIGTVLYLSDSNLKAKFQGWLGIAQADSVHENTNAEKTPTKSAEKKKPAKKRAKIPKIIKDEFASLDKYAKETPAKYSQDNATLAQYLEKPAKNDLEKARLIYSWIATHIRYDDDAFNTEKYSDETAGSVLFRRKAVCEGFSSLYEELGLLMGLEVEKIHGYAKGYGYQPGYKFSDINHAWNAVKINDTWKLIDVTWGSSESEATSKGAKSTMRFDPYWFLCETRGIHLFSFA